MDYRKSIDTSEELGKWYDDKYTEMGDGWTTPAEECNKHLDDLGVPFDMSKKLLDVGCGAGHFLVEAQKRVQAEGFEISQVGIQYAYTRGVIPGNIGYVSIEDVDTSFREMDYDYIVSLGSLEHIVNLEKALFNIHRMLKPNGKFYFLCPNETWKHFDQPNERTMADMEWVARFAESGLITDSVKRWNDSTAFIGHAHQAAGYGSHIGRKHVWGTEMPVVKLPPNGNKLNIGSGQRRFDNGNGWINVDCVSRPDQVPDLVCDVGTEPLPYPDGSMEVAVLHQVYEHFGLGEGHGLLREIHRTLKPGGSLIITVPDMRALAERWLSRQIEDYIYFVNVYGAYQGEPGDRHRWGYSRFTLTKDLADMALWAQIKPFDYRDIPGASIAKDFWILGIEAMK